MGIFSGLETMQNSYYTQRKVQPCCIILQLYALKQYAKYYVDKAPPDKFQPAVKAKVALAAITQIAFAFSQELHDEGWRRSAGRGYQDRLALTCARQIAMFDILCTSGVLKDSKNSSFCFRSAIQKS